MYWFGLGLVVVCLCPYLIVSIKHPGIYWNKTSDSFRLDRNDHIINVNLDDEIDVFCPYYPQPTPESEMEYYVIYQVNEKDYKECSVKDNPRKLINCSKPGHPRMQRYTIIFTIYGAVPNSPQFEGGASYYFITTSTGSKWGMDNPLHGACQKYNMKIKFNVCCGPDDKPATQSTIVRPETTPVPTQKPTPTKPGKEEPKKPVKDDKHDENEVMPKDQRQVGDNASSFVTSSQGLVICALLVIRLLSWIHCR